MQRAPLPKKTRIFAVGFVFLAGMQNAFADGMVRAQSDGSGAVRSPSTQSNQATERDGSAATGTSRVLMCFGGLMGQKFVIPDEDVRNPENQTSVRSCQLDGGLPGRGPQSPTRRPNRFLVG